MAASTADRHKLQARQTGYSLGGTEDLGRRQMRITQTAVNPYELKTFMGAGSGQASARDFDTVLQGGLREPGKGARPSYGTSAQDNEIAAANDAISNKFMDWMQMDPIERLRAQILESMGLNEQTLQSLPPEERKAIEAEIREAIEKTFGSFDDTELTGTERSDGSEQTPVA